MKGNLISGGSKGLGKDLISKFLNRKSNVINFRKEHAKNGRVNLDVCKKCDRIGLGFKY